MENNLTPWNISLEKRISELKSAKKSGKKVAAILYSDVDLYSSFRYRAYNIYQATKNSKKWQLIYFFPNELKELKNLLSEIDLLIFGRLEKWQPKFDELALAAKNLDLKIAYDLDDCVCGPKYIKQMFNVVSPDYIDQEYWIKTSAHMELISYLADDFIATNNYLGKLLSEAHDKKPYHVIPNFLNHEQINYAKELVPKKSQDDIFTIGYFSGSHTHATDFEVVYPELIELLEKHENFRLKIVGMLQLPESANRYIESGQINFVKMVDFLTLEKLISEVDVSIAPLADNIFTNCKSELKFFESALVKTPCIVSPSPVFKNVIRKNQTGILCRPGEWTDAILRIYEDKDFAAELAENAHNYVRENYYPEAVLEKIENVYDEIIK